MPHKIMSIRKRSLNTTDKKSKSIWHRPFAQNISCLRNLIVLSGRITGRGQLELGFGSVSGLMAPKISTHTHLSVPSSVTPALAQSVQQCLGTAKDTVIWDVSCFVRPPAILGGSQGPFPNPRDTATRGAGLLLKWEI